ncbi:MAG: hypothetical protein Q8J76_05550 [Desulfobulbaceae bacterium]|nr:hypothetical protein [Desulfobulbaceae bacterium]
METEGNSYPLGYSGFWVGIAVPGGIFLIVSISALDFDIRELFRVDSSIFGLMILVLNIKVRVGSE